MVVQRNIPEIPDQGPWSDDQIRLALETHHPVRIEMFGEERYWTYARENAMEVVARDFQRESEFRASRRKTEESNSFWSSVFRKIGVK